MSKDNAMKAAIIQAARDGSSTAAILSSLLGDTEELYGIDAPAIEKSAKVRQIVIPDNMNEEQAAEELMRKWESGEELISVARQFEGYHAEDVMVAVKRVSEKVFGYINGKASRTMFGTKLPTYIDITTNVVNGKKIKEQCFYGKFQISLWENAMCQLSRQSITCAIKKRYNKEITKFYDDVATELRTNSIYKGKAVSVKSGGRFGLQFEIFEAIPNRRIILNSLEETAISSLILPDLHEPGKRTYLFTGNYGNGKTEVALRIAKYANDNNQTFFYLKDNECFDEMLKMAKYYNPCVVFMEDVDQDLSGENRTADINKKLNTIDGVEMKGSDVKIIFTTNHENRINRALCRPGRIDQIVCFRNPTKEVALDIINVWLEDLEQSIDWEEVKVELQDDISGAVIAEIGKRARRFATRGEGELVGVAKTEHVILAIKSMSHHISLMKSDTESSETWVDGFMQEIGRKVYDEMCHADDNGYERNAFHKNQPA